MSQILCANDMLRLIELEVGPIGLIARVNLERALDDLIELAFEDGQASRDDDDDDWPPRKKTPKPKPPPPTPPSTKPDLYEMFGLKVFA